MMDEPVLKATPEAVVYIYLGEILKTELPSAELRVAVNTGDVNSYPQVFLSVEAGEDTDVDFPWEAYESPWWEVGISVTLYDYAERVEESTLKLHQAIKKMQFTAVEFDTGKATFERVYTLSYPSATGSVTLGQAETLCVKTGRYSTRIKGG